MTSLTFLIDLTDTALLKSIQTNVSGPGKQSYYASEPGEALFQLKDNDADIALVQANKFTAADLALLKEVNQESNTEVVLFSDGKPNPYIDQAMFNGVTYHFRSPYDYVSINSTLSELIEDLSEQKHVSKSAKTSVLDQFGLLLGSSTPMKKLYRTLRKVSSTEANVFVNGESGTGKELVANTIHLVSDRSSGPFIAVNCGALSPELVESELFGHVKGAFTGANRDHKGVFEQADKGTLFLDEITEMPLEHQVKLLRVLETGEYRPVGSDKVLKCNVRVVAASNRVMDESMSEFIREDLYYRLAQFPLQLPPLRQRSTDILGLAQHFLAYRNMENSASKSLSAAAIALLESHQWTGNVRELKHVVERSFILAEDVIGAEHILFDDMSSPEESALSEGIPLDVPLEDIEKIAIEKNLEKNKGNKSETADKLGISVKTLYNKLEKYSED